MKTVFAGAALLLTATLFSATQSQLTLRHRESQGVGYNKGYSTLDYFLNSQGEKLQFLFNFRGHLFNDAKFAGNVGSGLRYSVSDKSRFGMNFFYDVRDTSHFFLHQISGGAEWLSRAIDVRLNGYLPVGKKKEFHTHTFQSFSGNQVIVNQKLHAALPCIEGEVGTPSAKPFYFAVGTYYLFSQSDHSLHTGKAWGGKARFDVDMGRLFSLGAIATYDRIFKTRVQGYFSFHFPLGSKKTDMERDLNSIPIVRNEIIPIQTRRRSRVPLTSSSNSLPQFVFVNNQAAAFGNGSFEAPFASLKEAEANSNPGDVIYVFPGDGTARLMDQGIKLKEGQILASSSRALEIENTVIPALTPGVSPTITNINQNEPIVSNAGQNRLDNFIFMNPWEYLENPVFPAPKMAKPAPRTPTSCQSCRR